jgi:hypothetical protein
MFARMPRRAARALAVVVMIVAVGCGSGPSKDQCEKLLQHLIDLEVAAAGGKAAATDEAKAEQAKQKKAIAAGAAAKFDEACVQKTPKHVVECALAARTLEDVAKCDQAK